MTPPLTHHRASVLASQINLTYGKLIKLKDLAVKRIGRGPKIGIFKATLRDPKLIAKKIRTFDLEKVIDENLQGIKKGQKRLREYEETEINQALRIVSKFGGVENLRNAFVEVGHLVTSNMIYKWFYPKERQGRDGIIPNKHWPFIHKAARLHGILLTPEDCDARVEHIKKARIVAFVDRGKIQQRVSYEDRKVLDEHKRKAIARKKREEHKLRSAYKKAFERELKRAIRSAQVAAREAARKTIRDEQNQTPNELYIPKRGPK